MKFDWRTLICAGLGLGLKPSDFWALTPAELALMLGQGPAPMTRDGLDALARAFPDTKGDTRDR